MEQLALRLLLLALVLLGGAAAYQFFRGRRRNLELMRFAVQVMERVLRPRDKEYTLIGLYVGFTAKLEIGRGGVDRFEATVALFPRQSLFYIPIAKLTSRFDKIYMFFRLSQGVPREAHLVRKGYYRLGYRRVIRDVEGMGVEDVEVRGVRYHLVYEPGGRSEAEKLLEFARSLTNPGVLNHVALVPSTRSVYIAARLDPAFLEEVLRTGFSLARAIAGGGGC